MRVPFILGSLLAAVAYVASSFAPNIHLFFLTHGLISGFGLSLPNIACFTSICEYFDKKKSLALALYMTGISVGLFAWPPLATLLFNYYGWRGGFIILAGFQLQGCICGTLMRPFRDVNDIQESIKKANSHCSGGLSLLETFRTPYLVVHLCLSLFGLSPYVYPSAYLPTLGAGTGTGVTQVSFLVSVFGKSEIPLNNVIFIFSLLFM